MNEKSDGDGPFLTRRTGVKFVNEKLGVPLTKSTFDKKAMKGQTPRPDKFYGKTELYYRIGRSPSFALTNPPNLELLKAKRRPN